MLEKVKEVVAEQLGMDAAEISDTAAIKDDLGADSLDLYEMVMALEDEYGVEIPSEDLANLITVMDVCNYLEAHKA